MYRLIQRGQDTPAWPRPEGMPALIYALLRRRGVASAAEAEAFLHPDRRNLTDPMRLQGMAQAVDRVRRALDAGERVCVFGDYDVDGVCATAILLTYLREAGCDCEAYIPDRHAEGYGLNEAAVREIASRASLLITVDCGISCVNEVALCKSLGMDVIVTDHHRPGDIVPECVIVNPLIGDWPGAPLCGAGVAMKLVHALGGEDQAMARIDLAAMATVADLVPLTDENRLIVALGIQSINASPRLGIRLLCEQAGLADKPVSSGTIGFQLGPRINASGRLGSAKRALTLLTTTDEAEGRAIAGELEAENARRRDETTRIVDACLDMLKTYDLNRHRAIVLCGADWNTGVIGLVASQLSQMYHYPAIVLSETDGVCVGSCRSIPAVDIFEALKSCGSLFIRYGGHRQAAGLAIPRERVEAMIEALDRWIGEHTVPDDFVPEAEYDLDCPPDELTNEAVSQLDLMRPTGYGNPAPVFLTTARVDAARAVGRDGQHLQLRLTRDGQTTPGIAFGQGGRAPTLEGATRQMLFCPSINTFRGNVNVQYEIRTFLDEQPEAVFARYEEKYSRYQRTFLTELLYNNSTHDPVSAARPLAHAALGEWLRSSPQGTVIAAATAQGARSLEAFLTEQGLTGRLDAFAGRWPESPAPMNAACLSPVGPAPAAYSRLVLWDAPEEAFSSLPAHDALYAAPQGEPDSWMARLPDVDSLRAVYIAAKRAAPMGIERVSLSDIEREVARVGGLDDDILVQAALAVLDHMGLAVVDRAAARLTLPPPKKSDPTEDQLFRRLQRLRAFALGPAAAPARD